MEILPVILTLKSAKIEKFNGIKIDSKEETTKEAMKDKKGIEMKGLDKIKLKKGTMIKRDNE